MVTEPCSEYNFGISCHLVDPSECSEERRWPWGLSPIPFCHPQANGYVHVDPETSWWWQHWAPVSGGSKPKVSMLGICSLDILFCIYNAGIPGDISELFNKSRKAILIAIVHGANMGPIWGRQGPGGPHVGPMNFAIWPVLQRLQWCAQYGWLMPGEWLSPSHQIALKYCWEQLQNCQQ